MSAEENKVVVQRFWNEVFNRGSLDKADELFAPEWVLLDDREAGFFELKESSGPAAVKVLVERVRRYFSNPEVKVEDQLAAEENQVVTRFAISATHEDRSVDVRGISISQFSADGKIARSRLNWESGRMYEQLGWFPETEWKRPPF